MFNDFEQTLEKQKHKICKMFNMFGRRVKHIEYIFTQISISLIKHIGNFINSTRFTNFAQNRR